MLAKLDILLGKYAVYPVGFFMLLSLGLSVGWYISNVRLEHQKTRTALVANQLAVSNSSVESLKTELGKVTATLVENHKIELEQQKDITARLLSLSKIEDSQLLFESELRSRKPQTDCPIPKDLKNAYSRL